MRHAKVESVYSRAEFIAGRACLVLLLFGISTSLSCGSSTTVRAESDPAVLVELQSAARRVLAAERFSFSGTVVRAGSSGSPRPDYKEELRLEGVVESSTRVQLTVWSMNPDTNRELVVNGNEYYIRQRPSQEWYVLRAPGDLAGFNPTVALRAVSNAATALHSDPGISFSLSSEDSTLVLFSESAVSVPVEGEVVISDGLIQQLSYRGESRSGSLAVNLSLKDVGMAPPVTVPTAALKAERFGQEPCCR